MPISIPNPYSGKDDETCSVSFAAQQSFVGSDTGNEQTEAEYYKSKMLGEWGVLTAKLQKGQIPDGTKILTFSDAATGSRGYLFVKGGKVFEKSFTSSGTLTSSPGGSNSSMANGLYIIDKEKYNAAIPQAVSSTGEPEPTTVGPKPLTKQDMIDAKTTSTVTSTVAITQDGGYKVVHNSFSGFSLLKKNDTGHYTYMETTPSGNIIYAHMQGTGKPFYKPTAEGKPPTISVKADPPASMLAAPTPTPPVNPGSASVGSMSDEDVSAMFVSIKDTLAKEKGLNIKGANPELDKEVYDAIAAKTGYTGAEVKAKIDAYKAAGNKLSALKKKVLSGSKKVPDPKPHDVPTKATATIVNDVVKDITDKVEKPKPSAPTATPPAALKLYTDEDIAAQYIIAKDAIVAASNGKWTLYTKSDEMDAAIYQAVQDKTGYTTVATKQALANYLGSGKKLSVLKKQLAKQGAFTPQADTLKKSGAAATQAEKDKEANEKADAGYTPTPTPASAGSPPVATGKPAPKRVEREARESGDISGIPDTVKKLYYDKFKGFGYGSYLSSSEPSIYDAFIKLQAQMQVFGHSKNVTLLQLIRVIDEEGAKKFKVDNGKLFEKKVVSWLTSPAGTKHVKDKEEEKIKLAEQAKKLAEAEKLAKELEANQPPLPPDSPQFQPWSLDKAKLVSQTWLDAKPWTDRERRDLKYYTGSAYTSMNGYLRGIRADIDDRSKNAIVGARSGMRPTTEPILVARGTGLDQFKELGLSRGQGAFVWGLTGKTFTDKGFVSTSAGGRAAFGGEARLEIECPVGTPMAYVAPISNFPSENEMLLQAGMQYKVLNVRKEGSTYVIRMRVVNWPGKAS